MLERSVTGDAELVDPTGRREGIDGLAERIGRYQSAAPGTKVVPASDVDAHNDVMRVQSNTARRPRATRRASFEFCAPVGLPLGQLTSSAHAYEEQTSIAVNCQTVPFVPDRRPTNE
jgi:hypothetical protein